jgi:anti-anti-sigma factor
MESTLVELARRRVTKVSVDLSDISFIDSGGLRALVIGYRAVSVQGGTLAITKASEQVRRVLEMAGADSLLAAPPGDDREQIAT